jgi:hypothetical protein
MQMCETFGEETAAILEVRALTRTLPAALSSEHVTRRRSASDLTDDYVAIAFAHAGASRDEL